MILVNRATMPWHWHDPFRKLRHRIYRSEYQMAQGVKRVSYATYCGHSVTVDDINPKTKSTEFPTCMRCIIAEPIKDVINAEE
jgi:hypothetical protein